MRARLAARAEDWPWSSARAHVDGGCDGLTDAVALAGVARNWRALLRRGLEAADDEAAMTIEAHQRTGRPLGDAAFVKRLEQQTGRVLTRRRPGPKPKGN